jgi:NAD(P)-dependent dehydrogenase (short-subunit alcohol dehydrogenase family)
MNIFSLSGKTALIVGASRGIGLAIAKEVARAGANTILASRNLEALEKNAEELRAEGLQASALQLDVTDPKSIEEAVAAIPQIDILHAVSGVNTRKHFEDFERKDYDYIFSTNLIGIADLIQAAGRKMIAAGKGGKIVIIGSLSGVIGVPYVAVYSMTKGGVTSLARTLGVEWARHNIQVNCIAPGFILTDLNRKMWQDPKLLDWLPRVQPNPNLGTPADIAPLAVFLSGQGSNYITGQVITVDGGFTSSANWPFEPA